MGCAFEWPYARVRVKALGPEFVDLRGHYLNRCDQGERNLVVLFDALSDALSPLRELSATI